MSPAVTFLIVLCRSLGIGETGAGLGEEAGVHVALLSCVLSAYEMRTKERGDQHSVPAQSFTQGPIRLYLKGETKEPRLLPDKGLVRLKQTQP